MKEQGELDLRPFRRRIRLLRAWRCGAIGGSLGAALAIGLAVADFFDLLTAEPWMLAVAVAAGTALGIGKALLEKIPDALVARSMDRRTGLEDRLTTAAEVPAESGSLAEVQHADAVRHLEGLRPSAIYPVRPGRWHGSLLVLSALTALIFVLGNTAILRSRERRDEAQALKRTAAEVQRVMKPALEQAKLPESTAEEKDLARRLKKFSRDLNRARMSRQEALVKANDLAERAQRLEQTRTARMSQSVQSAQTAAARLEKMGAQANLARSDQMRQAEEARSLEKQIADMEHRLAQGSKAGKPLSKAERKALDASLAAAKKRLQEIRLSQRAQDMLAKLAANADFQEAQRLLAELARQAPQQASQASQAPLSKEQMEAMAKRLDDLAKRLSTDEALKEYARQLKEAAKNARLCKNGKCAGGLLGAFGLAGSQGSCSAGGLSLGAQKGAGGPSPDRWVGAHGTLPRDDKSSLLNVKFEDRVLTSERGDKGPETYVEVMGPSKMGGKSSVPYQKVLPKYEKSAESALQKSDIPPSEQRKVRDYFDALRK